MTRRALGLTLTTIAAIALVPCAAGAQAATADGIQAIVRADYQSAVRILRPLAEEAPDPDPLAQFFMAMLYQSYGPCRQGPERPGRDATNVRPRRREQRIRSEASPGRTAGTIVAVLCS